MKFVNPYALKIKQPKETVLFSAGQRTGAQPIQQDSYLHFNDECFVVADGVESKPHGDTASKFACETAVWGYKHIRQRPYYWQDKKLFMRRIFRSTNLAVWQKQREVGFQDGMATSLMVLIIGAKHYWFGSSGMSCAWLFHDGNVVMLTPEVSTFDDLNKDALGVRRLGLVPIYKTGEFVPGDVLILASSGCGNYLTPFDLQSASAAVGNDGESVEKAVQSLLTSAQTNGSTENMTVVIVKRI